MYSAGAIYGPMKAWAEGSGTITGTFDRRGAFTPSCRNEPLRFDQHRVPMTGFETFVATTMLGTPGSCSFGLQWTSAGAAFPEYFRQDGEKLVAVASTAVPDETGLKAQTFAPGVPGKSYSSPADPGSDWTRPGPVRGPFTMDLADGSRITYSWYRFVDQPALQHLHLSDAEKARLQRIAETIHREWPITSEYMAPPTSGRLAALDPVQIVTPPRGLEAGYVPIVTRQEAREQR
jgi:hypothetical protein